MRHLRTPMAAGGKFVASSHMSNCVTLNAMLQVKKGKYINIFEAKTIINIVSSDNLTLDLNVAHNLNQPISVLEALRVRKEFYSREIESAFKNCKCFPPDLKMGTPSSEVQTNSLTQGPESSQSSLSAESSSDDETENDFDVTQRDPPSRPKRPKSPIFHSTPLDSLDTNNKRSRVDTVAPAVAGPIPIVQRGGKDLSVLREMYRQQNSTSPALPSLMEEKEDSDDEVLSPIQGNNDYTILTQGTAYSQENVVRSQK